jgi:hypothetical protein
MSTVIIYGRYMFITMSIYNDRLLSIACLLPSIPNNRSLVRNVHASVEVRTCSFDSLSKNRAFSYLSKPELALHTKAFKLWSKPKLALHTKAFKLWSKPKMLKEFKRTTTPPLPLPSREGPAHTRTHSIRIAACRYITIRAQDTIGTAVSGRPSTP